jgi:hypothetical protein
MEKNCIIHMRIGRGNYWLSFDRKFEEGIAEGLRDNATRMTEVKAEEILTTFESEWPLKIEKIENPTS